jgi:hypothetical protein
VPPGGIVTVEERSAYPLKVSTTAWSPEGIVRDTYGVVPAGAPSMDSDAPEGILSMNTTPVVGCPGILVTLPVSVVEGTIV